MTVSPKKDTVTVSKKVQENQDGVNNPDAENWGTAADYNMGDYVPFQLTGTLPPTMPTTAAMHIPSTILFRGFDVC